MINKQKILSILRILPLLVAYVLLAILSFFPVDQGWSSADSQLTYIVLIISAMALISLVISRKRVKWCAIDSLLLGWWAFIVVSAYLPWPSLLFGKDIGLYPVASIVLPMSQMLALYFALRLLMSCYKIKERHVAFAIVIASLCEALLALFQTVAGGSRHALYSTTGTFFNPGSLGIYVTVGFVAAVALWREYSFVVVSPKQKKVLEWVILFIATVMLSAIAASWSRTAFVAIAFCLLFMFRSQLRKHWLLVSICLIFSVVVLYFLKQGSANGRAIIAATSFGIFADNLLLGTGIGSFFHQYAEQMASYSPQLAEGELTNADVIEYPFNIFLRLAVEQGIVGLLFALSLLLAVFFKVSKSRGVLCWCFLALIVASCFSYVVELQPFQLIFVVVLAFFSTYCQSSFANGKRTGYFVTVFCIFVSLSLVCLSAEQVQKRVDSQQDYNGFRGQMSQHFLPDYYRLLPQMSENSSFLFSFAKSLREAGRYNDSNDILRRGTLVSTDPMFYVLQGNNYLDLGEASLAEVMYTKAFAVMPNRLYPLYKLMNLYIEHNDSAKALSMADRIIAFHEKVSSAATHQMKEEAQHFIDKSFIEE